MNKFLCVTFHGPDYVIVYTFYNICPVTGFTSNKYEDYSESNLRWAVNETNEKNIYKYIHKLLLNIVTAGIEALVLGNKFLYACVKEVTTF
jgi:hypothetical protein